MTMLIKCTPPCPRRSQRYSRFTLATSLAFSFRCMNVNVAAPRTTTRSAGSSSLVFLPQIEVAFDADANSMLNVSAHDKAFSKLNRTKIANGKDRLSKEEIERMMLKVHEGWGGFRLYHNW